MKREFQLLDRREFLGNSVKGAALIAAIATGRSSAAQRPKPNPFAYDLSRLEKTDPKLISHEEIKRWQSPHEEARRIAISPDDTILLASGNFVTAHDLGGARRFEIALTEPARAMAADGEGLIYVALRDHIEIFSRKASRIASWDSPGKKAWLTGLALHGKELFAADSGNRVVLCYDLAGKLVRRIGEKNRDRNIPGFIVPSPFLDVEIARDGLLRVNNPGRHRVEAYTTEGDFEFSWGSPSMGLTGFCGCCNPINLALLPDGRYVTCEKGLPRVKIYSASGEFESVVAGPESFPENAKACAARGLGDCTQGGLDAVCDHDNNIHILDLVTAEVRIMRRKI